MWVHYKMKCESKYKKVNIDGSYISVRDLKLAILVENRMGSSKDYELQIINSDSGEVYEDDKSMIMKNATVYIARKPLFLRKSVKTIWKSKPEYSIQEVEDHLDKLKALKTSGEVPEKYTCFKCYGKGHWKQNCPLEKRIIVSSGIPMNAMIPVEGPDVKGAMLTRRGTYAIPKAQLNCYTHTEAAKQVQPIPIISNRFDDSKNKGFNNTHSLKYRKTNRLDDSNKENIDFRNPHWLRHVKANRFDDIKENIDFNNPSK